MNVAVTISYDGTNYSGWQRQPHAVTVQGEIEKALAEIAGYPVETFGASRTDRGVHALGQCFSFYAENFHIPVERLPLVMNTKLPEDIVVKKALEMPPDFHPRFSAKAKTYEYTIVNGPFRNPLLIRYSEYVRRPLDVGKMNEAAQYFLGTHDFKAFCAAGSVSKTTVRTLTALTVGKEPGRDGDIVKISVTGSAFLYNMVRILAGTLIDVGLGRKKPEDMEGIILSGERRRASATAGAAGLTLIGIQYE